MLDLTEAAEPREGAIPLVSVPLWAWAAFVVFVLAMLALDLFVLHRGAREVSLREAALGARCGWRSRSASARC